MTTTSRAEYDVRRLCGEGSVTAATTLAIRAVFSAQGRPMRWRARASFAARASSPAESAAKPRNRRSSAPNSGVKSIVRRIAGHASSISASASGPRRS